MDSEEMTTSMFRELRALAAVAMQGERADHTLQPTALVHEALIRVMGADVPWENRRHFLNGAARAMQRVLIDHARARNAAKRGGGLARAGIDLEELPVGVDFEWEELEPLDRALEAFARESERAAEVVRLRYFFGLTISETAEALGVSKTVVKDDWQFARAWLKRAVDQDSGGSPPES